MVSNLRYVLTSYPSICRYDKLGLGWGNSLIAFIAIGLGPIPWFFYYYGEKLRTHPKWQVKF
ncbi:Efflux pump rdc3 [Elasticomyces elasticus]|nr:Efflux pump rdc3 [Elasticomyces elasticus]